MKIPAQHVLRWIAALSALVGTALVLILLYSAKNQTYLLTGMESTALIGMAALILNVLLDLIKRDHQLHAIQTNSPASRQAMVESEEASIALRRKVIDERLQIDDPRLCSEKKIFCTCWSFCGGDTGLDSTPATVEFRSRSATNTPAIQPKPDEDSVPTVERGKITDCPFP